MLPSMWAEVGGFGLMLALVAVLYGAQSLVLRHRRWRASWTDEERAAIREMRSGTWT